MAYTNQDKYEMTLRQARVDIGQGRGNALSKAVDLFSNLTGNDQKIIRKMDIEMFDTIFHYADKFAEFNQKRIDEDYQKWLEENDDNLKTTLGIVNKPMSPEEEYFNTPLKVQKVYKAKDTDSWRGDNSAKYPNKTLVANDKEGGREYIEKQDLKPF